MSEPNVTALMNWMLGGDTAQSDLRRKSEAEHAVAQRLAPVMQKWVPESDPQDAVDTLLVRSPEFAEDRNALLGLIDQRMKSAASMPVPRGISPSERQQIADQTGSGWYALGPGDQQRYAVLRDSNLVRAAAGVRVAPSIEDLASGKLDNTPVQYGNSPLTGLLGHSVDPRIAQQDRDTAMRLSARMHQQAEQNPTKHASLVHNYYPQTSFFPNFSEDGGVNGSATNFLTAGGDSLIGRSLMNWSMMENAAGRAVRKDNTPMWGLLGTAKDLVRGVVNYPGALMDESTYTASLMDSTSPSPKVPDGIGDQRNNFINARAAATQMAAKPTAMDYAHSQGRSMSPAWEFFNDFKYMPLDPGTVLLGGVGPMAYKTGMSAAKGGLLAGLKTARAMAPGVAKRVAIDETIWEPTNVLAASAAFPWGSNALTPVRPKPGSRQRFIDDEKARQEGLRALRVQEGMLDGGY
jgi:hypothetical protein